MKHNVKALLNLAIFLTSAFTAEGQWSTSPTQDAYNTNPSGKVGIGIQTPASYLHVNSTSSSIPTAQFSSNYAEFTFGGHSVNLAAKSTFSNVPYISWSNNNGQRMAYLGWRTDVFNLQLENNFNFSINGGKVGIGTTTPQASLHVSGGAMILEPVSGNAALFTGTGGSDHNRYLHLANSPDNQSASGLKAGGVLIADNYSYANPGRNSLVVKGNIGIATGTGVPAERLHIGGDGRVNIRVGRWASLGETYNGLATVLGSNVKASNAELTRMEYITDDTEDGGRAIKMQYNEGITFHTYLGNVTAGTEFTGHERMRIDNNGNVGIGTGTATLDHRLDVNGTIHAEEVKVDLTVPGPDYVFEPDYDLTTLAEIESYIKENKHLPEVPSAKEMEENGMNLKEMNLILLKKVEELTLHLIAQQKEIEDLKRSKKN